jgi:hypothetical protein
MSNPFVYLQSSYINQMSKIHITDNFESARWAIRLLVLASTATAVMGVMEWINPSTPPFKGRLTWLWESVLALFGPAGLALTWLFLAASMLLIARFIWRHTSKSPSDSWLF